MLAISIQGTFDAVLVVRKIAAVVVVQPMVLGVAVLVVADVVNGGGA